MCVCACSCVCCVCVVCVCACVCVCVCVVCVCACVGVCACVRVCVVGVIILSFIDNHIDDIALVALTKDFEEFRHLLPSARLRIRIKTFVKNWSSPVACWDARGMYTVEVQHCNN